MTRVGVLRQYSVNACKMFGRMLKRLVIGICFVVGAFGTAGRFTKFKNRLHTIRQLVEAFSCDQYVAIAGSANRLCEFLRVDESISLINKNNTV